MRCQESLNRILEVLVGPTTLPGLRRPVHHAEGDEDRGVGVAMRELVFRVCTHEGVGQVGQTGRRGLCHAGERNGDRGG